jgi:5'-phosphate synthase pdxT subunit
MGTCAGMILMAKKIEAGIEGQPSLGLMDIVVERNAFGRQIESFEADLDFEGVNSGPVRAVFIRAPIIKSVGDSVKVLSYHEGRIVAAQQGRLLALSFHPELTTDTRVHEYFLSVR